MNVRTATFCLRTGHACIHAVSNAFFFKRWFFYGLLILIVCGVGGKPLENNHTLQSDSGCVYICKDGSYQELIYLEQPFIRKTFKFFGFYPSLLKQFKVSYCNSQSCILNSGWTSNFFELRRRVRQVYPLSPCLLIHCVCPQKYSPMQIDKKETEKSVA